MPADRVFRIGLDGTGPHCGIPCDGARSMLFGGGYYMSLQILINGLATGSVYALIATGFALIFNVLKFSNFSHGATMTAAAFVA